MNILYIHQYFATPRGSTGTRSYEFARRWVQAGHRVTMLTSTAQLTPADVPGGDLRQRCRFTMDGITVDALPIAYSQKMGRYERLRAFVRFMWESTQAALRMQDVDLVYATSTPLTVGVPALLRRWLRGTRYVFEVRDLWPAVPRALGYLPGGPVLWLLRWFERRVYRSASAVVALSPGMRDGVLDAGGRLDRILVAPNCCDTDRFRPGIDGSAERRVRGWGDKFVAVHVGAMGMANGLDFVIAVADRLRDEPAFHFVLVGDGRERPALEAEVRRRGLSNVEFAGAVAKERVPALLAGADAALVIFAAYPILEHNSANKLFDALSAGKPILLNYSGWQREMLESAGAGLGVRQGDVDGFVEHLRLMRDDPAGRAELGRNARQLAETRFSRDHLAAEVLTLLEHVAVR